MIYWDRTSVNIFCYTICQENVPVLLLQDAPSDTMDQTVHQSVQPVKMGYVIRIMGHVGMVVTTVGVKTNVIYVSKIIWKRI